MVSAWFGGSREGQPDTAIYIHNLRNDGKIITFGTKDSMPRWNPILVPVGTKIYLFTKAGIFCDRWQTFLHDITDWTDGITDKEIFATAEFLPAGINGPVKSKPLIHGEECTNRIMYCGSSVETQFDWTSYIESYCIDPNDKITFGERSKPLNIKDKLVFRDPFSGVMGYSLGVIQPALWEQDGIMKAFFRSSRGLEQIYYSERIDGGWTLPVPTNFPNPNSAVDVVYMNNRLFLVHNPSDTNRHPLVISEIKCEENVTKIKVIDQIEITKEVDKKISCISPELSYPYMVGHDGRLHLAYTYGRSRIEYVTIEV